MWAVVRRLMGFLLKLGRMPEHVAFVMDGNRRYAARENKERVSGHSEGYKKLVEIIHWCLDLGIRNISAYAFSIGNFNRSPKEVEYLMNMAERKYRELIEEGGLANEVGLVIKVLGNLSLAPEGVQRAAARMMTHCDKLENKKAVLNLCFSYSSSEEVCQAVNAVHCGLNDGILQPCDASTSLLEECLYTKNSPPVDLMVRTSGENRLSDFLLWQCRHAILVFEKVLWPDYSFMDFVSALIEYQRKSSVLDSIRHQQGRINNGMGLDYSPDLPCSRMELDPQGESNLEATSNFSSGTICGNVWQCCKSSGGEVPVDQAQNKLRGDRTPANARRISSFIQHREYSFLQWLREHSRGTSVG